MKLVKGSLQAKRYMASIRAKKNINGVKEKDFYIDYLNKDKNFTKDKKYFDTYEKAIIWGKKNFERFNTDMINSTKKIGNVLKKLPATKTIGNLLRKCKINGLPINFQASLRGQAFYIVNQYDIYNNVILELTDKKTNQKFASVSNQSKTDLVIDQVILWLKDKGVQFWDQDDIKYVHKEIKPLIVNLIQEVKLFNKGSKRPGTKKQVVKKAPIKKVKVQRLRPTKVSSKTSILKESNLIRQRLKDKKMIMPHGYQVKRSMLSGMPIFEYKVSQGNKYYVTSDIPMKSTGITLLDNGTNHRRGLKTYTFTENALKKMIKFLGKENVKYIDSDF